MNLFRRVSPAVLQILGAFGAHRHRPIDIIQILRLFDAVNADNFDHLLRHRNPILIAGAVELLFSHIAQVFVDDGNTSLLFCLRRYNLGLFYILKVHTI